MRRRGHYCAMYVRVLNDETVLDNGKAYLLYRRSSCFRQIISVILSHAANQRANEYAITMWMGIAEALSPSLSLGWLQRSTTAYIMLCFADVLHISLFAWRLALHVSVLRAFICFHSFRHRIFCDTHVFGCV